MQLQPWWHTRRSVAVNTPLEGSVACDVLVVGGGFSGLHAALRLAQSGAGVVLLEKTFCGGSTSGFSSGLITPDSELPLHKLIDRYGRDEAAKLWGVAVAGVELIASTASKNSFNCELEQQDSLFAGIGADGARRVDAETEARTTLGYANTHYNASELAAVHPGNYSAAVRYSDTWTMNPFSYCQELRDALVAMGVRIFEKSEVRTIHGRTAVTSDGSVTADSILVCIDKMNRQFNPRAFRKYYHARTWLAISVPLEVEQIEALFPDVRLQCWDSQMIYTYYRLTPDNRLLVGGGSALTTFLPGQPRSPRVINSVLAGFRDRFRFLRDLDFTNYWSGGIDITGDLLPLADFDPENDRVHYVMGCAGLPWAAWCGDYAARRVLHSGAEDYSRFFGWKRQLLVTEQVQRVIGKIPTFTLNYFYAKR